MTPGSRITMSETLNLWLVNQYAIRIDQPGITRHATLAKYMHGERVRTTIFASPTHYWNVGQIDTEIADPTAPSFRYVATQPVETNGVRRVASMVSFAARAFAAGVRAPDQAQDRPDVVEGSSPHPFAALAAWGLAKRYRVPFVLEVRDLWPNSLIHLMGISPKHPLIVGLRVLERFLYRQADLVITLLPGSERHIERVAGRAIPSLWIPNGMDLSRIGDFRPAEPSDNFTVMYAGAHGIPNALHTVLEAAEMLKDTDPDVRFVLIGDGKEKANLEAWAADHALTNVEFRAPISKHELLDTLPTADTLMITWLRSPLYKDGISPNKVFDYFSAGRPIIIAVDTPINPVELAEITTPPEDAAAVAQAVRDLRDLTLAERNEMGERGRRYGEANHDLAKSAVRIAERLRALIRR
jgi:glycosyltransferase involved in cell wall biosynthesis